MALQWTLGVLQGGRRGCGLWPPGTRWPDVGSRTEGHGVSWSSRSAVGPPVGAHGSLSCSGTCCLWGLRPPPAVKSGHPAHPPGGPWPPCAPALPKIPAGVLSPLNVFIFHVCSYLVVFGCAGPLLLGGLSVTAARGGYAPGAGWAARCGGLSCCRAGGAVALRLQETQHTGSAAWQHVRSSWTRD